MREVATAVVGTSSTEKGNKSTVVVLWCAKKAIYIQLWPLARDHQGRKVRKLGG